MVAVVFIVAALAFAAGWVHLTVEDARTFLHTIRS